MKKLIRLSAKIHLFLLQLNLIFTGGLAKSNTWERKKALEDIIKENS